MIKSLQTLKPITDAPSLHAKCDKPSVVGFSFMNESIKALYEEYHSLTDIKDKLIIAKEIYVHNKQNPPEEYWRNEGDICLVGEIWEPIYLWRNHYEASSLGRIRCWFDYTNGAEIKLKEPRIIKQHLNKTEGYLSCGINRKLKDTYPYKVNWLIAYAFYEKTPELDQSNHIDGIKTNNIAINLEWCDRSYNMKHAHYCGLRPFYDNDNHHNRKLNKEEVIEVYYSKENYNVIEKRYNITHSTIARIKTGQLYKHLTGGIENRSRSKRLTKQDIVDIYKSKEKTCILCARYNTKEHTVQRIRNGENYKNITANII